MRVVLVLALALNLAGCRALAELADPPEVPAVVPFEVFNRTLEPVFLVDADGRRLDVPPCDDVAVPEFRVNRVEVRTDRGYVFAFGSAGQEPFARRPQYLVLVARDGESFPVEQRPANLPPCEGRPNAQPGV